MLSEFFVHSPNVRRRRSGSGYGERPRVDGVGDRYFRTSCGSNPVQALGRASFTLRAWPF
jgi:hypothetical protein